MTNPVFNPQPNYSGVTIQIANPAVNLCPQDGKNSACVNNGYCGVNQSSLPENQFNGYVTYPQGVAVQNPANSMQQAGMPNSYPAQYYLNNYNYSVNGNDTGKLRRNELNGNSGTAQPEVQHGLYNDNISQQPAINENIPNMYRMYANNNEPINNDMTKSDMIKENIAEREAEIAEEKKNTKETKIVALTDDYIKSLENYLNNPNDEIRLMASKEILTRLDEDKDRYDDAALNALLNKMMQDPNKLVRIAALSAFNSQLASGNDYTVTLLHNIQKNPNSDKEDVLQAADILLKMSAGVEVKNIPNPSVKDKGGK